jgi:two-component system response regulator DesR
VGAFSGADERDLCSCAFEMTRVLLYSDEPILAKGLESVLRQIDGFELLPTSNTLASMMEQITQGTPDLVLMDLTAEVTFAVLSDMKPAMKCSRFVLWVTSISTELAFQAMGLGVRAILRKTLPAELQVKCLQKVQTGELWFEKALTDSFLSARRVALTQREGQLVSLLSQGLKNKEIAATLMITEGTVKVYLSRLFQKVGVKDRFELALFGLKNLTTGQLAVGEKGQQLGAGTMPGLRSLVLDRPRALPRVQHEPQHFGPPPPAERS